MFKKDTLRLTKFSKYYYDFFSPKCAIIYIIRQRLHTPVSNNCWRCQATCFVRRCYTTTTKTFALHYYFYKWHSIVVNCPRVVTSVFIIILEITTYRTVAYGFFVYARHLDKFVLPYKCKYLISYFHHTQNINLRLRRSIDSIIFSILIPMCSLT